MDIKQVLILKKISMTKLENSDLGIKNIKLKLKNELFIYYLIVYSNLFLLYKS